MAKGTFVLIHLALCAKLLVPIALFAQPEDCDLKKDKEGIKVYTCKSDTSKFRSLRAEFQIEDCEVAELEKFLFNVPNFIHWQYNALEVNLLQQGDRQIIYRLVIDAPWPVENRELIMQLTAGPESATGISFHMNTIAYTYPMQDDLTRVPFSEARWKVEKHNRALKVTYEMNIDPGGYVPPLLVNMAMADGPYQSFSNLKRLIQRK